jgi:O-antigen/teichoic acid export membrane protein
VISGIEVAQNTMKCLGTLSLIFISASWQQILIWTAFVTLLRGAILIWSVFYGLRHLVIKMNISNGFSQIRDEFKAVVRLMFTTSGVFIIKTLHTQSDTVLVGMVLGPASSGAYKLARNIVQLLAFPTNALFQVSFPEFTRLLKTGESVRFHTVMTNLLWATFGLCVVYCLGMWFIAPYILPLIIGDSYQRGIDLLPILVIGLSLVLLSQYWHAALVAVNKAGQVVFSMAAALIIQVTVILVLLESYGIKVAAVAYVCYCLTRAILLYCKFKRHVPATGSQR